MGYRLSWHSAVYGGKRPSGKAESVVSPEALRASPVKFDENGKLAKPPMTRSTMTLPRRGRDEGCAQEAQTINV